MLSYLVFSVTLASLYAITALGLNTQWGYTGMLNIGVAAFYSIGAYATAIVTGPASESHFGGFGLAFPAGLAVAIVLSGAIAFLIGLVTLNLRSDYLAIATIGIAEIIRLVFTNEDWLTNGVRGIAGIPRPLAGLWEGHDQLVYMLLVVAILIAVYWLIERGYNSPWGRVLRAIREDEPATASAGKNVLVFRLQAFVLGSMAMGLAGALYAHFVGFVSPEAFRPDLATFLIWVMLIAGGSGNNRGAILGAFVIWAVWSGTEILTGLLPQEYVTQGGALRVLLIGVLLQVILLTRPQGLLPERPPKSPVASTREGRRKA
ncbi:MAG: branched-chain amino acid ABC transporter permease [Gammaproteobacteria bacterium]|nr:branched-chain amino acid ABC transporter permease [Gammaproteobacteria bacterium]